MGRSFLIVGGDGIGRRRYRRLVVGSTAYNWRVDHQHILAADDHGVVSYSGCQEVLTVAREGSSGVTRVVFSAGARGLGSDEILHSGAVVRTADGAYLNFHQPGTVRALIEVSVLADQRPGSVAEIDGWQFFDAVLTRRASAGEVVHKEAFD